jgi:hypothetical protein
MEDKLKSIAPAYNFIVRTQEEDIAWAKKLVAMTVEEMLKRVPKEEPWFKLNCPEIKAVFPHLSTSTLKKWAMKGRLGKLGEDKKFYVQISEIKEYLFKNN